jgi:hypothetical protein
LAERLGVNITLIAQLPPAATLEPHGFDCEKSAAFAPVMVMPDPVILSAAFPVLDRVTDCAAEVVPDACDPKVREVGFNPTAGAVGGAVAVREKLAVEVSPLTAAVTAMLPDAVGVAVTCALPLPFVLATPELEKLAALPLKVTLTSGSGLPFASATRTTSGLAKAVPWTPVWPEPETAAMLAGGPRIVWVNFPLLGENVESPE